MFDKRFLFVVSLAWTALPSHAQAPGADLRPNLSATGGFDVRVARAGDTVEYRLRVEWRDAPAALMILPPREDLKTPGFVAVGQSVQHRKIAASGEVRNSSEFTYRLVAQEPGTARVLAFPLRYRSNLSDRVESVQVGGTALRIEPAYVPLARRTSVRILVALILLAAATAGLVALRRRRDKTRSETPASAPVDAFTRGMTELRNRCDAADSRVWLRDAEKLCVAFLCRGLGVSKTRDVRFEAALDPYLARHPARTPGEAESWVKLRDLFHEARYAGGRKDPHELREACRHLKNCLASSAENGEHTS